MRHSGKGRQRLWTAARVGLWLTLLMLAAACSQEPWNDPYRDSEADKNILYSSFEEQPKHLDPVRSYSSDEYAFICQIYEPLLQYHYLKQPYELIPLSATEVPEPRYLDVAGRPLPEGADESVIARVEYEVRIKPGVEYQPHPAFARNDAGGYLYHALDAEQVALTNTLNDFPERGTRELTADDFVYQIKRLAAPYLHSPVAGLLGDYVVGFAEFGKAVSARYTGLQKTSGQDKPWLDLRELNMEGVEVLDRYRFRIRLSHKYPQFVYWLAMPFFSPMPWEAEAFYGQPGMSERNITLNWYPVGTGPFMLTENNPNLRMVLSRNPNFHGEAYPTEGMPGDGERGLLDDAGKTLPLIEKAVYSLEKESIPYWNKFLQGYYDVSGVSSDSFDQAVQFNAQGEAGLTDTMRAKGIKLQTAVTASIYYTGFNMRDPVVGGDSERARLLRRAISIAIDEEEYISIFANGRGLPAQGPIPPGIFGFQEGEKSIDPYVYDWVDGAARRKNIDEARKLMEKAGYAKGRDRKTGEPLILYYDVTASGPDDKARLNWFRKQFAKLDIQLVLRTTDYNRFQEKIREGNAQIFTWGWNADYPDPENFFFLLYGPNGKVESGGENASNYSNPEFDRLFEQMKNMSNGPERQRIVDEMLEVARRDAPWVWGFHPKAFSLYHGWYHNAKPNLMANNTLKYKRVDPAARQSARMAWNKPVVWPVVAAGALLLLSAIPAVLGYRRREKSSAR